MPLWQKVSISSVSEVLVVSRNEDKKGGLISPMPQPSWRGAQNTERISHYKNWGLGENRERGETERQVDITETMSQDTSKDREVAKSAPGQGSIKVATKVWIYCSSYTATFVQIRRKLFSLDGGKYVRIRLFDCVNICLVQNSVFRSGW